MNLSKQKLSLGLRGCPKRQTWQAHGGSILFLAIFCFLAPLGLGHCLSTPTKTGKFTVNFSWHERGKSLLILAKDLKLIARVQPRGPFPYSHNSNTAVWLGVDFPHDKAIRMISWSRNYYRQLRYIALSDYVSSYTDRYDNDLFIGGSTRKALKLKLQPWTEKDFKRLKRVRNKKQLQALIRSRYAKGKKKKKKG